MSLFRPNTNTTMCKAYEKVLHKKNLLERAVCYYADFKYTRDGETVVEDSKGMKTKDYIIKRKLILQVHGIRIKEV